jgi:hypothetical protein
MLDWRVCAPVLQICGFLGIGLDGLFWPEGSIGNVAVIDKRVNSAADAVAGVRDGSTVLVAGFGAVGVADHLLDALHEQGARELTVVANNSGNGDYGLARLINAGRVRR